MGVLDAAFSRFVAPPFVAAADQPSPRDPDCRQFLVAGVGGDPARNLSNPLPARLARQDVDLARTTA